MSYELVYTSIHSSNIIATEDIDKANLLNSYFSQVFTQKDVITLPLVEELPGMSFLSEIIVTPDVGLNVSKSTGPDGLHSKILKELDPVFALPIIMCNN